MSNLHREMFIPPIVKFTFKTSEAIMKKENTQISEVIEPSYFFGPFAQFKSIEKKASTQSIGLNIQRINTNSIKQGNKWVTIFKIQTSSKDYTKSCIPIIIAKPNYKFGTEWSQDPGYHGGWGDNFYIFLSPDIIPIKRSILCIG